MKDLPDTPARSLHPYGLRPCIYCLAVLPGMAAVIGCVTAIVATPALVIAGAVPSHTSYIMAPNEALQPYLVQAQDRN